MQSLFPKQLKKYRTNLAMSQEDVADKLFISRQAVSRWESGDAMPDITNLIKLSEIFDCSLDSLVLGVEPKANGDEHYIDPKEFTFDPRKGKYIRKRHGMNFWEFLVAYWWVVVIFFILFGDYIFQTLQTIINLFK
ncbi:helix-turn-helix transcriptional regulator [Leuconostoc fallax]|uniref:helix-turn-helix transcriptional regulator n=1 Tax=Leuconostoc fallax TaxID=1251 RepID=UPI0020917A81|nr:helix-turn-helix transcriptional regulator [Leuconostoc fallax]MCO6183152.1 helix-turn-helix domain-containing protein [Leuconostoc fallax]